MNQLKLNRLFLLAACFVVLIGATGCATLFRGYKDKLVIRNLSDTAKVFTSDSVELQVFKSYDKEYVPVKGKEKLVTGQEVEVVTGEAENRFYYKYVLLPTKRDYILVIKEGEKETRYEANATIETGWFLLDCLNPLALLVDLYTGNLNGYSELKLKK